MQEYEFFLNNKASYIKSKEKLLISETTFGLLQKDEKYTQIGSKKRSSFAWKEPAIFNGVFIASDCRYVLFNETFEDSYYWYYAFPCLEDGVTLVHFSTTFQSCRDIKIDSITH